MFTLDEIEKAHDKVQSGTDFPSYIQEIKKMGVQAFETWVIDSHTVYYGLDTFQVHSQPKYEALLIQSTTDIKEFSNCLLQHQQGKSNYFTFCQDCAKTGVQKWIVDLQKMTCSYYDQYGSEVWVEKINATIAE